MTPIKYYHICSTIKGIVLGNILLESVAGIISPSTTFSRNRLASALRCDGLSEAQIEQAQLLYDAFETHNMIDWNI